MTGLLHSSTLLAPVSLGCLSAVCGLVMLFAKQRRLMVVVSWSAAAAFMFAVVSFRVHIHFGHGQGAPEPMALPAFWAHHSFYLVVALLVLAPVTCCIVILADCRFESASGLRLFWR
jgi:hypothetical protein